MKRALVVLIAVLGGCGGSGPAALSVTRHRTTTTIAIPIPTGGCTEGVRPDPACTPGAFNPQVTQATIHQTICVKGWTATVRPPVAVTNAIKVERFHAYRLDGQPLSVAELDHFVPLEVGGAPADVKNLWPELYSGAQGARTKDRVENLLKARVCAGTVTLAEAQHEIVTDWTAVK